MPVEDELIPKLVSALPRDLLLDLIDMGAARALLAHEVIRDHTDLKGKSARGAEGQVRFRLMEKGFQDVCELHGGVALADGLLPGTELRFYQPFMRFEGSEGGVILALASMPGRGELPSKNKSRAGGVSLNYHLTPRLCFDASDPKPGDVFVLFLVARDPARSGHIDEVAIGAIDAQYNSYLFYEAAETFITNYVSLAEAQTAPEPVSETPAQPRLVTLKAARRPFEAPETPGTDSEAQSGGKA